MSLVLFVWCFTVVMAQLSLHKYFKPASKIASILPSPERLLLRDVQSSSIAAANKRVSKVVDSMIAGAKKIKGSYERLYWLWESHFWWLCSPLWHVRYWQFKSKHPSLNWSTVNNWKKAVLRKAKIGYCKGQVEPVETLPVKKRGRPA